MGLGLAKLHLTMECGAAGDPPGLQQELNYVPMSELKAMRTMSVVFSIAKQ